MRQSPQAYCGKNYCYAFTGLIIGTSEDGERRSLTYAGKLRRTAAAMNDNQQKLRGKRRGKRKTAGPGQR
ncbi:hypothetical protein QMS73_04675, partial [Cronobacter sakazakii]|nr:hypothetical protein [Cronobacter sakazakii]